MTFDELLDLIEPYSMSDTIEDLGEAKRILHENAEKFKGEEREKIAQISVRLMREIDSLIQLKYGPPSFEDEDDEDDPNVIYIPAGRKASDPVRKL
jgi:hypothetical protein